MPRILMIALIVMQAQVPLIDLVAEPSRHTLATSISAAGFSTDGRLPPTPKPPLVVRLESITTPPAQPAMRIVDLLVTNVSGAPYSLPVGRDGDIALKTGNRGRRQVWFWLRTSRKPSDPLWTVGGAETYASLNTEGSLMTMRAGESVRVRFPVDLKLVSGVYALKKAGVSSVEVYAECQDQYLDDNRTDTDYIVRDVRARSESTLTLRFD
jgi:hypothetical protein